MKRETQVQRIYMKIALNWAKLRYEVMNVT